MADTMEGAEPRPQRPLGFWIAGIAALLVVGAVYWLRLDSVVGLFVDDGWYVLLAKALASGQGYSIVNSPSPGILPLYPPAFSFLLSLVFRLSPQFPDNLWLLKTVSVLAMVGTGLLAYRYFTKDRELSPYWAMAIAAASVLSPPLVFLATSTVMSECLFAFVFLATIVVVEASVRAGRTRGGFLWAMLGGALASAGFLTRSIALSLIVAGVLYLLKVRLLPLALAFAVTTAVLVGPWMIYARAHAPTLAQRKEQGGHIVLPYTEQFWQRRAGFEASGRVTVADLPARVVNNSIAIAGRDIARIIVTPLFEALRDPFVEAQKEKVKAGGAGDSWWGSFLLSLIVAVGFVRRVVQKVTMAEVALPLSLGIILLWPWETFRFVLPLVPFALFYAIVGVRDLLVLWKPAPSLIPARVALAVLALVLFVNLYGNLNYILQYADQNGLERPQWLQIFDDTEDVMKWSASHLPSDTVIVTDNPPLLNLYTGRKTIALGNSADNWENWERLKVRYLVVAPVYYDSINPNEKRYKVIYQVRHNPRFRVIDLGEPGARAAWGQ